MFGIRVHRFALIAAVLLVCSFPLSAQPQAPTPSPPEITSGETASVRPSDVQEDQPAVPTTDVPSPAEPDHSKEQVMWALVGTFLLQYLKKTAWFPFLTEATTKRAQAAWGFGLAVLTAVGVNVAIQGSVFDTTGAAITFSGVSLDAFKDIVWQWASQQGWYQLLVKNAGVVRNV